MKNMEKNNEKKCWACKRILLTESKTGLCPDCINKYGSPAAAVAALAGSIGIGFLLKKAPKWIGGLLKK